MPAFVVLPFLSKVLVNVLVFVLGLGFIIFVHELGHYLVAKAFGVRVVTFSLGFGKRLWGFRRGETDYRVSLVPLGGYVRMGGEMPDERTGDPREFLSKPRWQRILVYLAGPAANVVLAVGLMAALFVVGIPTDKNPPVVGAVEEGSPAAAAGLAAGDRIVALDGESVDVWRDVDFVVATSPERAVAVEYEREGARHETVLTPRKVPRDGYGDAGLAPRIPLRVSDLEPGTPAERAGFRAGDVILEVGGRPVHDSQTFVSYIEERPETPIQVRVRRGEEPLVLEVTPDRVDGVGRIGVYVGYYRQLPLGEAIVESVHFNVDIVVKTVQILGKLFTARLAPQSAVAGPVGIADSMSRAAEQGIVPLVFFIAVLSTSIAFVNLLPIPILDGGHVTILVVECLLRRDLSLRVKERVTQVGFMMLMTLMAVVLVFDLARYLPGS